MSQIVEKCLSRNNPLKKIPRSESRGGCLPEFNQFFVHRYILGDLFLVKVPWRSNH